MHSRGCIGTRRYRDCLEEVVTLKLNLAVSFNLIAKGILGVQSHEGRDVNTHSQMWGGLRKRKFGDKTGTSQAEKNLALLGVRHYFTQNAFPSGCREMWLSGDFQINKQTLISGNHQN